MKKIIISFIVLFIAFSLVSCNVTRQVTTQAQYFQRGDTSCTIITKTIETYDARKNNPLNF